MYRITETPLPPANRLLSGLSKDECVRLLPHLHHVNLGLGHVISNAMDRLNFAYFPTTCMVSLISAMQDGGTAEIALIGNDGILGTSLFLGGDRATNSAVVGLAGEAFRVDARVLRDEFGRAGTFQRNLLRYTDALMAQISLTAACNSTHRLEKRFCRWLLLTRDRTTSDELVIRRIYCASFRRSTRNSYCGCWTLTGCRDYPLHARPNYDHRSVRFREGLLSLLSAVKTEYDRILATDGEGVRQPVFEPALMSRVSRALS